ncbi:DNA gyrase inhibitor YacG [Aestuariispira insulae]|uniref:DNA gyrase inhibitor YacG n=1 Tax=Aestuariispira insulae TaxID=1461337 RepID=A0A3D9HRF1_9PROT|nr:DNA gyrase inhibitor YacG [Aestuariispira insulae]RED52068.1 hypothetical protein DFP90_10285 [Aestuariispira insulae]
MGQAKSETGQCSICGKPSEEKYKPFCSRRCADVDLHRWMGGTYRIPTEEPGFINDNDEEQEY